MMKKIVLAVGLCISSVAWAGDPVVSGYGIESYHGYIGVGYNRPFIGLDGYKPAEADGISVLFGHNYKSWLDLEFRASTATGYQKVESKISGQPSVSVRQNYNIAGLLKFKWQPISLLEFSLDTGLNYMDYEKKVGSVIANEYKTGLVLGAGLGLHITRKFSINADYQSYQRNTFLKTDTTDNTWSAANLTFQYHF